MTTPYLDRVAKHLNPQMQPHIARNFSQYVQNACFTRFNVSREPLEKPLFAFNQRQEIPALVSRTAI